MNEIGNTVIITKSEYRTLEEKARMIIDQRNNTQSLNMRLRFPYFIPDEYDIESHRDLPISELLPYYIYIMVKDEAGNYLVEPHDDTLNSTREYMKRVYENRIIIVENAIEEQELIDKYSGKN